MEIKDNKIIFKADEQTIDRFKLALNILGKDADQAFQDWLMSLSFSALRNTRNSVNSVNANLRDERSHLSDKLDNKIVQFRIQRWVRNKIGFAYKILVIFFHFYNKNPNHVVKRAEMKREFYSRFYPDRDPNQGNIFIGTFRQMCSDSGRAYGLIFKYNNEEEQDEVRLHPLNEEFILSLKEEFNQ